MGQGRSVVVHQPRTRGLCTFRTFSVAVPTVTVRGLFTPCLPHYCVTSPRNITDARCLMIPELFVEWMKARILD